MVDDPKAIQELDLKVVDILKIQYILIVREFRVLVWDGVLSL